MTNFRPLENILNMDFRALRADNGIATDEAIETLVENLNAFFRQFEGAEREPVSEADRAVFNNFMNEIIVRINRVERDYFAEVYANAYPDRTAEEMENMLELNMLVDYSQLPERMQYWSAGFGGVVRNAGEHREAVRHLQGWDREPNEDHDLLNVRRGLDFFGAQFNTPQAVRQQPRVHEMREAGALNERGVARRLEFNDEMSEAEELDELNDVVRRIEFVEFPELNEQFNTPPLVRQQPRVHEMREAGALHERGVARRLEFNDEMSEEDIDEPIAKRQRFS